MVRPRICRNINFIPSVTYFKPRGVSMRNLDEVVLQKDELEALRLKDLEGLDQSVCAEKMNISQPTFHRLVVLARKKVSNALINGMSIKIEA